MSESEILKQLPLIEQFYSIQGEGFQTGKPAYFIRIGGCDIGCNWCDTKVSWNKESHELVDVDEIIENIKKVGSDSLVVTGGEPTIYDLTYLTEKLKENNIRAFIETSGNHNLTGGWDWVCLSPKEISPPLQENYKRADELKVIIHTVSDFEWAEKASENVNEKCKFYLQPEWSQFEKVSGPVVEYIKANTKWNLSLQIHKFVGIP